MKFLAPTVSVILTAHMKPFVEEALQSLERQTRQDFGVILVDSGAWRGGDDDIARQMADIHAGWRDHPMVEWVFTAERLGSLSCPVGVATNLAIRAGLVNGRYVCHFYDDDEYHPQFIEKMAGYLDEHPDRKAVWCSQDRARIERDGGRSVVGHIPAYDGLTAGNIDCLVDGGQVMYRREVLDALGDPWMPEDPGLCSHSDGVFLDRVAQVTGPIGAIPDTLVTNRKTPLSAFSPT